MTQFKARPTVYKGIQMRSRLEAGFAAWLDSEGLAWTYEPFAVADGSGQYLPDFLIDGILFATRGRVIPVVAEVKPQSFKLDSDEGGRLARAMCIAQSNLTDCLLVVIQPDRVTQVYGCPESCDDDHGPFGHQEPRYLGQLHWIAASAPHVQMGLARVLPKDSGPWADEYWKVD